MTWMLNPALTQHKETPMPPCSSQICAQTRITNNEKLRKFTKKIHIVTNSIVKVNLSNLPKLSHFREIGEKFRKFNRNPSAFQVEKCPHSDIHEGAISTAAGRPVHHWQHHHHQASGRPIATTPSKRRRVNQQKCFFMANNRVGERPR